MSPHPEKHLETHLRVKMKQRQRPSLSGWSYLPHKLRQKMAISSVLQQMYHAQTPLWECAQV